VLQLGWTHVVACFAQHDELADLLMVRLLGQPLWATSEQRAAALAPTAAPAEFRAGGELLKGVRLFEKEADNFFVERLQHVHLAANLLRSILRWRRDEANIQAEALAWRDRLCKWDAQREAQEGGAWVAGPGTGEFLALSQVRWAIWALSHETPLPNVGTAPLLGLSDVPFLEHHLVFRPEITAVDVTNPLNVVPFRGVPDGVGGPRLIISRC
jgi:hypothetical protein